MSNTRNLSKLEWIAALSVMVAMAGCGPSEEKPKVDDKAKAAAEAPKPPAEPPKVVAPPPPPPAPQPAPVAPVAPPPPVPAPKPQAAIPAGKWVELGRLQADFRKGSDRITVGRAAGSFRELRVTVRDAPMEMHDMVVTFVNKKEFRPKVKFNFNEKTTTGRIDLPGEKQFISHVDFVFRSPVRREGMATVILHGR